MTLINKKKGNGKPQMRARLLAALLCLSFLLGALTPCVAADEAEPADTGGTVTPYDGKAMTDTYVLTVSTGICAGRTVLYFGVRYIDKDGMERTEFIMPHDGALSAGYKAVEKSANINTTEQNEQILDTVKKTSGYELPSAGMDIDGLQTDSFDSYVFTAPFGLTAVTDVQIFMRHGNVGTTVNAEGTGTTQKNEWTCNGICIYRMDTLYGMRMAGYWSTDRFIDFDGKLVAEMTVPSNSCVDFSIGLTDKLFSLGTDKGTTYGLVCYGEKDAPDYSVQSNEHHLLVRMDIADFNGAGIEALANEYRDKKAPIGSMGLCEALTIVFEYRDINGYTRTVRLPFITSAVGWMASQVMGLESDAVIGIAQQGDILMFEGTFPDYVEMTGFEVCYGTDAASIAGIMKNTSNRRSERLKKLESDTFRYTSFSIYDAEKTNTSVVLDGAVLTCECNGTPLQVYTTSTANGQAMNSGDRRSIGSSFRSGETADDGSVTLVPTVTDDVYVVEIITDYPTNASTVSDIKAAFTYIAQNGREKTPDAINLRDAVSDYTGYWPAASLEDVSYVAGTSSGGSLVFTLNYSDVQYFKSVELTLDGTDDWQMESLNIYRTSSVSSRKAEWLSTDKSVGTTVTDRNIYREFSTDNCIGKYDSKVLMNSKNNQVVLTLDGSGSSEQTQTIDWEKLQYSMTYNETLQNLGFTKALKTYEIAVQVQSNSNSSEVYGDCGSINKFYFQLIFEKGQSAYVQANQQLTSDGFRAGKEEKFTISVNRDYGDLRAVRILPDDVLDEDNMYDKLNIDYITVTEDSTTGICRSWRIRSVGWVDIDFKDNGQNSSNTSIKLRTEYEMTKSFQCTDKGYEAQLLFVLGIGEYIKNVPYEGTLTATVYYRDSNKQAKSTSVDIAKALAEYAQRDVVTEKTGKVDAVSDGRGLIDSTYMLRESSVNRFFVRLNDVTSVESVTLEFGPTVTTTFTVTSLDIYQVTSDGKLLINANNEYQWDNQIDHITGAVAKSPLTIETLTDTRGNPIELDIPVDLEANTISINQRSWETEIQREPLGDDDTLNIYLYSKNGEALDPNITVSGTVQYQMRTTDRTYQTKIKKFDLSPDRNVLYTLGVNAQALSALRQLSLKADAKAHIDHAVVQQVRYGVVVGTYYLDFGGEDAQFTITAQPTAISDILREKQVVRLNFSADTDKTVLSAEETDLVVMFSFTTLNDIGDTLYDSAYVYLTDQQIKSIESNEYAEIVFDNHYIKDIRSVSVIGVGAYNATVSSVEIRMYSYDSVGHESCTGVWQSEKSIPVTRSKTTVDCSQTDAVAVEITLTGSPAVTGSEKTPDRVSLVVALTTDNGQNASVTVDDLSKYLISGGFAPGQTAVARLVIAQTSEIRGLILEPHSNDSGVRGEWSLGSISVHVTGAYIDETAGTALNRVLEESEPYIYNLKGLHISTQPITVEPDGSTHSDYSTVYEGESAEITVPAGTAVYFKTGIENAIPGYETYTATVTRTIPEGEFNLEAVFTEEEHMYVLRPGYPEGDMEVYTVTFVSDEDPTLTNTFAVVVAHE